MAPTFSVIVPVRDDPLVGAALRSIVAQDVGDFEVIVVDDGSSPPLALDVVDERIRLLRHETARGPGAARNTGIRAAKGRYVAFLDSDDLYLARRLALARIGHDHAPVVIVRPDRSGVADLASPVRSAAALMAETIPTLGITSVERRALLEFDEAYLACQDVEWWLRIIEAKLPIVQVNGKAWAWRKGSHKRILNGPSARLAFSYRLLEDHKGFFAINPEAASFRWRRIAMMERREGSFSAARAALLRSARANFESRQVLESGRLARDALLWGLTSRPIPSLGQGSLPPIPRLRAKVWSPHTRGSQESRIRPTAAVVDGAFRATSGLPRWLRGRVRRAATMVSRGKMQDAETAFGVFRSPSSDTRILAPYCFEPLESAIMCRLVASGDVAVDIGANLGWYTNLLATRVGSDGHVVAVEPDPALARNLKAVAAVNGRQEQLTVLEAAVSDRRGVSDIVMGSQSQLNHLLGPGEEAAGPTLQVRTISMTDVFEATVRSPQFVKIDVEGVEPVLLEGLLQWIDATSMRPPKLMFEFEPVNYRRYGTTGDDVLARLATVYELFSVDAGEGGLVPVIPGAAPEGRNIVAVPIGTGEELLRVIHGY